MNSQDIFHFSGKRPLWKTIFSTACFTFFVVCMYQIITMKWGFGNWGFLGFWSAIIGWQFGLVFDYDLNLTEKKYKITKRLGPYKQGEWKKILNVRFVSISKTKKGNFKVLLKFSKKRRRVILKFENREEAVEVAQNISEKLNTSYKYELNKN